MQLNISKFKVRANPNVKLLVCMSKSLWWVPDIAGAPLVHRLHFFADRFPGNKKLDPLAFALFRLYWTEKVHNFGTFISSDRSSSFSKKRLVLSLVSPSVTFFTSSNANVHT